MEKILIIEDSKPLREEIAEILELEGYHALSAGDGEEGLTFIAREKPDLVICDIMMPKLDGYQVLEKVRKIPDFSLLPFIFLTAMSSKEKVRAGMNFGANDYLTKPFSTKDLLSAVQTQLLRYKNISATLTTIDTYLTRYFPHELRTPLNSILGFSSILCDPHYLPDEQEVRKFGKVIFDNAKRLYRLSDNQATYANLKLLTMTSQEAALPKEDLLYPCAAIYKFVNVISEEYQRSISLYSCNSNTKLNLPEHYLSKILSEVIDNSVKFSKSNSPISVRTTCKDSIYSIEIEDFGSGISKEKIQQMGPYVQFDRAAQEQQGSGLGLTIVSMITSLYKGNFEIRSVEGQGTTVLLSFPCSAID